MDLARHFDAASRLSPKSAAIALRLLDRIAAMITPRAHGALRDMLLDQSRCSNAMSDSDLMALIPHDAPTPPGRGGFVFETSHHRMARLWIEGIVTDASLREGRRRVPDERR